MNGDAILLFLGLGAFLLLDIVVVLVILSRTDRTRRTDILTAEERLASTEPGESPERRRPLISRLVAGGDPDPSAGDLPEDPVERKARRKARDPVSPYVKAVAFATLAFISLFGILFALTNTGIAAPLLVVGFFVILGLGSAALAILRRIL